MQREKLDFLTAVGEKLCNLDAKTTEMQKLEGMTDASANAKTEKNHKWDDTPEEFVDIVAESVSILLLFLVSSSYLHRGELLASLEWRWAVCLATRKQEKNLWLSLTVSLLSPSRLDS